MIYALKPFYTRIYMINDFDCNEDVYEFLYKTSIKNDRTTIVLNKFDQKFIDEVVLFKNVDFQISVTSDKDIVEYPECCYFCNDSYLKDITFKDIGVYHDFSTEYHTSPVEHQYNIDETIVRNTLDTIINNLTNTSILDGYQNALLEAISPCLNQVNSAIDLYLFQNRNSLFLDSQGNFYSNITYTEKLGNILTDNIEVSLFRYIERGQ